MTCTNWVLDHSNKNCPILTEIDLVVTTGSDLAPDNTLFALKRSSIVACFTELLNSQQSKAISGLVCPAAQPSWPITDLNCFSSFLFKGSCLIIDCCLETGTGFILSIYEIWSIFIEKSSCWVMKSPTYLKVVSYSDPVKNTDHNGSMTFLTKHSHLPNRNHPHVLTWFPWTDH